MDHTTVAQRSGWLRLIDSDWHLLTMGKDCPNWRQFLRKTGTILPSWTGAEAAHGLIGYVP